MKLVVNIFFQKIPLWARICDSPFINAVIRNKYNNKSKIALDVQREMLVKLLIDKYIDDNNVTFLNSFAFSFLNDLRLTFCEHNPETVNKIKTTFKNHMDNIIENTEYIHKAFIKNQTTDLIISFII